MTAYGTIVLRDNDGPGRDRLAELREGAGASGATHRAAVGVARQMVEAWLLSDPELPEEALPPGKTPEELWGEKKDGSSNYPKHVLRRSVLGPRGWSHEDAIRAWDATRARTRSPSLDEFCREVEALADRQGAR